MLQKRFGKIAIGRLCRAKISLYLKNNIDSEVDYDNKIRTGEIFLILSFSFMRGAPSCRIYKVIYKNVVAYISWFSPKDFEYFELVKY